MKKLYNELKPTILLFLFTFLCIDIMKDLDLPIITACVVLLIIKIVIDLSIKNNIILKNYYFDNILLGIFMIQVITLGIASTYMLNAQMFSFMSIFIFISLVIYLRWKMIAKSNLKRKSNEQFEFLSKSYLYIKYLEESSTEESFKLIKSKFSKLLYEVYYINDNKDLGNVVDCIESYILNCDLKTSKTLNSIIKDKINIMIDYLYDCEEYKKKIKNLSHTKIDINAI